MRNRLWFLKLATALLYFGALLAGLMGQGWGMVLAFLAVFLVWSVILQPHLWPSRVSDLAQLQAMVPLASLIATQALLVVLCFGIGRGIGGVVGLQPALPGNGLGQLGDGEVPVSGAAGGPRRGRTGRGRRGAK